MGLPKPVPFDFLSEGDSPTFFLLFDWGFRTLENFAYGGIAGRYHKVEGQVNTKGEALNLWDVSLDHYTDRDGKISEVESMWPYVCDIQRDFAARVDWAAADTYDKAEHAPYLEIEEGTDLEVRAGEDVILHAKAKSPDDLPVETFFRIYEEASASCAKETKLTIKEDGTAVISVPGSAGAGSQIHVVVKAMAGGHHRLVHYQQVILTVK